MSAESPFGRWLREYEAAVLADDAARRHLCVVAEQFVHGRAEFADLENAVVRQLAARNACGEAARRRVTEREET